MKSKIMLMLLGCCYSAFTFAVCNVDVNMSGKNITNIGTATLNATQSNPADNDLVTKNWVTSNVAKHIAYETYRDGGGWWINIPAYTLPSEDGKGYFVNAFSVMKYEAKELKSDKKYSVNYQPPGYANYLDAYTNDNSGRSYARVNGSTVTYDMPVSAADGRAYNAEKEDAKKICQLVNANLITASQYYSLARHILENPKNWYTGTGTVGSNKVGEGKVPGGRMVGAGPEALTIGVPADPEDANVYYKTNIANNSTSAPWEIIKGGGGEQIRVFYLGNSSKIWDLAGNAWEMMDNIINNPGTVVSNGINIGKPSGKSYGANLNSTDALMALLYYSIPVIDVNGDLTYSTGDMAFTKLDNNIGIIAPINKDQGMIYGGGLGLTKYITNGNPNNAGGLFTVGALDDEGKPTFAFRCAK